jgi:hypothetical protein
MKYLTSFRTIKSLVSLVVFFLSLVMLVDNLPNKLEFL